MNFSTISFIFLQIYIIFVLNFVCSIIPVSLNVSLKQFYLTDYHRRHRYPFIASILQLLSKVFSSYLYKRGDNQVSNLVIMIMMALLFLLLFVSFPPLAQKISNEYRRKLIMAITKLVVKSCIGHL